MKVLTPRLDVKSDDGLGDGLGLGLLLLLVLGKSLLADAGSLLVLLLVAAEQVDIVVITTLSLLRGLSGVDGHLGGLRAVGAVGSSGITGEGGELALVAGDVLVPSGSVGVLLGVRGRGESLEDGDISLRGALAIGNVSTLFTLALGRNIRCVKNDSEMHKCLLLRQSAGLESASETRTNLSHHRGVKSKGKK
jgi:hypothetical protein